MVTKVTKAVAKQWLADVSEEKRFWCSDGRVFKNLTELESALKNMSEEVFRYHVNAAKNDFSNWVRDVVGDEKLSVDLLRSVTLSEAAGHVKDRITSLKKTAGSR